MPAVTSDTDSRSADRSGRPETGPPRPEPRGPLSAAVLSALRKPPGSLGLTPPMPDIDALVDDDLQLALYCCYELHYRGLAGAHPEWEWDAALLAYLVVAVLVTHHWGSVLAHTFVPHIELNKAYLALLVAVLGTTISPYLFFWQSAHRLEEMRDEPEGGTQPQPLKYQSSTRARRKQATSRLDVFAGMTFSNLVMFAIIVATAQTLHAHHQTNIQGAAQAAQALTPFAGRFASALFALGFIGSGLLAVPVLAGAGSVGLAGLLGKKWGFSRSVRKAPVFYGLVALGTLGGTALSLLHVNPIKLLVLVAVINGVAAAPFLVVVMRVSASPHLMGDYVNGKTANILGWTTATIMAVAAISLFATGGVSL